MNGGKTYDILKYKFNNDIVKIIQKYMIKHQKYIYVDNLIRNTCEIRYVLDNFDGYQHGKIIFSIFDNGPEWAIQW
jgi:hypothetical protein